MTPEDMERLRMKADVFKVDDIKVFADCGVFMPPALVIGGDVKVAGKLPKEARLLN